MKTVVICRLSAVDQKIYDTYVLINKSRSRYLVLARHTVQRDISGKNGVVKVW